MVDPSGRNYCKGWGIVYHQQRSIRSLTFSLRAATTIDATPPPLHSDSTIGTSSIRVELGSATLAGTDPDRPQKVNQDGRFVFQNWSKDESPRRMTVVGILDGHGLNAN